MKKSQIILILLVILLLSINTISFSKEFYTMATASVTGDWYASGIALCQTFNEKFGKDLNMNFSAISSAGSPENIDLLRKKEVELATLQNNMVLWPYAGLRKYEGTKFEELRILLPLFDCPYHFLVKDDINSLSDIRGKRFVVGAAGSGVEVSSKAIFGALGIIYDDFKQEYLEYVGAGNALRDGLVDGLLIPTTIPASVVTELMTMGKRDYKLLSLPDEEVTKINTAEPWMSSYTIPENSYANQPEPIKTLKHSAFLVSTDEIPEEVAYLIVKTTWENLDVLESAYHEFGKMDINNLESFFKFPVPIHPGAIKYYKEVGVYK